MKVKEILIIGNPIISLCLKKKKLINIILIFFAFKGN